MDRLRRIRGALASARWRLALAVAAACLLGLAGGLTTLGAFVGTTSNSGDAISSGTVALGDNDSGAMFSLSALEPNDTDTGCIKVEYTGSLPSEVRLYGTTSGTGADAYASVTVTRGTYNPSEPGFDSCTNFTPDGATYISGQSQGVIYTGTLANFPDSYAAGLVDPTAGSPESWTTDESHVYKFHVTQGDNSAAEGKTATQEFTWEARNQ